MTAADQPTTEPTTITVPRPHVTHGPEGVAASLADADYLRAAVRNIKHQNRGESLWGSGVTAMVSKLLNDAADALLAPAPQPAAPDPANLEIVNGWLVERGAHPSDYPGGAEWGPMAYSDAEPLVRLSDLSGWPAPQPATDTDTEVQWGWCDDTDADPKPRNVKVCESYDAALAAVMLDPAARVLLCGTPTTRWEEA